MAQRTCSARRCQSPVFAQGWCQKHYEEWAVRDGDLPCSVNGCDRRASRRGMCFRHWQRLHLTGSTEPKWHFLSNVDEGSLTADCEVCGPRVSIYKRSSSRWWICTGSKTATRLKRDYGISPAEYEAILKQQGGLCAICRKPPFKRRGRARLFVDHDHRTGVVRAGLCGRCNSALGLIGEDPDVARRMIDYIAKYV